MVRNATIDGRMSRRSPEGIVLSMVPAGPAIRLWAWAIDQVICWVALILMLVLFRESEVAEGLKRITVFLVWWFYPIVWESRTGRTIGKKAMGLRVVRRDGLPVGWREGFLRGILLAGDFLPFAFASGLICMLFVPDFRRFGDLAANTVVVYEEKDADPVAWDLPAPQPSPIPLMPAEQRAILDLAERHKRLSDDRARELGDVAESLTDLRGKASMDRLLGIAAGLLK